MMFEDQSNNQTNTTLEENIGDKYVKKETEENG